MRKGNAETGQHLHVEHMQTCLYHISSAPALVLNLHILSYKSFSLVKLCRSFASGLGWVACRPDTVSSSQVFKQSQSHTLTLPTCSLYRSRSNIEDRFTVFLSRTPLECSLVSIRRVFFSKLVPLGLWSSCGND